MTSPAADPPAKSETDECEWTPSLAECLAEVFGIDILSELHWRVISECREERANRGGAPDLATLAARSHMTVRQLESLFPEGEAALAWILAGVVPPSIPWAVSTETTPPNARNSPTRSETESHFAKLPDKTQQ